MSDFKPFAAAVHAQYSAMSKYELFVVDIDGDALYDAYLAAFPEGSNPMFRERTEHDCSCCKNFIRNIGNVVAIIDDQVESVWDFDLPAGGIAPEYTIVAGVLATLVRSKPIAGLFRSDQRSYGAEQSKELRADSTVHTWNHFHGAVASKHFTDAPGTAIGAYNTNAQMLQRAVAELTPEALATVIDLAEANNLYKGEESLPVLRAFRELQQAYLAERAKPVWDTNQFIWTNAGNGAGRIRNTAIGTLLQDLSAGVDLEKAVKSFEDKVSGTNYKRPTALITPRMVADAMKTIDDLGLEPALARRHANIGDITINNVLWADRSAASKMKGGLEGMLLEAAVSNVQVIDASKAEDISIADFMANVAPQATSIDLVVKNAQQGNFMSITAPVHVDAPLLFKWDNGFSWSYAGNIADSELRKRVAGAGGRVDGVLRFSHSWNYNKRNASLMDLHVFMPGSSPTARKDQYGDSYPQGPRVGWNNRSEHTSGGVQDVDYVTAAPEGYVPVENITFPDMARLKEGVYTFKIHNWAHRDPTKGGFKAEIEFGGQVFEYERTEPMRNKEWVTVAEATLKNGEFTIEHKMPTTTSPQDKWGMRTEDLVKVSTIMHSPNHWDGNETGNRHYFFILEGAKNPDPVRGVYNEFLKPELDKHRKVFETIGDKTKAAPVDDQLSGVGFSTTKRDSVLVSVTGAKIRKAYNINF